MHNISNHNDSEKNLAIYLKILSWAHLNFEIQMLLQKEELATLTQDQLETVGYKGPLPENISLLFEDNGFFSKAQTSQRIASFTLKTIGLDKTLFTQAEKGIRNAYEDVKQNHNTLLDTSFEQTLRTLSVFKP